MQIKNNKSYARSGWNSWYIKYTTKPVKAIDLDQLFCMLVDLVKHKCSFERFKLRLSLLWRA